MIWRMRSACIQASYTTGISWLAWPGALSQLCHMTELADRIIGHYEKHARNWTPIGATAGGMTKCGTTALSRPCRMAGRCSIWVAGRDHPWRSIWFNAGFTSLASLSGGPALPASLDAAQYEKLLTESGFEVVVRMVEDRQAGGHTVWLARSID